MRSKGIGELTIETSSERARLKNMKHIDSGKDIRTTFSCNSNPCQLSLLRDSHVNQMENLKVTGLFFVKLFILTRNYAIMQREGTDLDCA